MCEINRTSLLEDFCKKKKTRKGVTCFNQNLFWKHKNKNKNKSKQGTRETSK